MSVVAPRSLRRALVPVAALALAAGCRDRGASRDTTLAVDSSLAQDLAMAQRDAAAPMVFNDAPVGGAAPTAPAPAAPAPRQHTPPRASAPTPRPVPRRESPPAPIARSPQPTPSPAPGPAPAPAGGVIGAGTRLGMTTNGRVCAATALAGDKFTATVTSATTGSNGAIIPAGSTVVIEVASVDRSDPIENSRISFRVRSIDVDGVPHNADGDVATLGAMEPVHTAAGNTNTKVIGGAVAGAILGRILGGGTKGTVIGGVAGAATGGVLARRGQVSDACLPNGSPLQLTLSRDIALPRAGAL